MSIKKNYVPITVRGICYMIHKYICNHIKANNFTQLNSYSVYQMLLFPSLIYGCRKPWTAKDGVHGRGVGGPARMSCRPRVWLSLLTLAGQTQGGDLEPCPSSVIC